MTPHQPAAAGGFHPANEVEEVLYRAARERDRNAFIEALLGASALLPVPPDAPDATVTDPGFRWPTIDRGGRVQVPLFTSRDRLTERVGESGFVLVPFATVMENWPNPDWALALNPDTPVGATLDIDHIRQLADWARQIRLAEALGIRQAPPSPELAAPVAIRQAPPSPEPAAPVAPEPAALAEPAPAAPAPGPEPPLVQKVLPDEHLDFYLQHGYDRVGGLVHRYAEVQSLHRPAELSAALALPPEDAQFTPDAPHVHVIRWEGHCPGLYRPAGQPPHLLVHTIAVPHRTRILRLDSIGEHAVASYDADLMVWRSAADDTPLGAQPEGQAIHGGYRARWRGEDYEASPDGDLIRLYTAAPAGGFAEVRPGRYRRLVPAGQVDGFAYVRLVGAWQGEPVLVLAEQGGWLRVEYLGEGAGHPDMQRLEPGVHQSWVQPADVTDIHEDQIPA